MESEREERRIIEYGAEELDYLAAKDSKLAEVIAQLGPLRFTPDDDLFASVVRNIVGQQITSKAQESIWRRALGAFGSITPGTLDAAGEEELQSVGISFRKAGYIKGFAHEVASGAFDLDAVRSMDDADAIAALSSIRGIGTWTAEMLLLFSLGRPDILSFNDLGIQRGLRMLYHHRAITPKLFAKYRRRYSPYGSAASLILWRISDGTIPGMRDYAPKKKRKQ